MIKFIVLFALEIDSGLLIKSFLSLGPNFTFFFFKSFSLFINFAKLLLYTCHKLFIANYHEVSEEYELAVIVEDVTDVLGALFFDS